MIINFEEYTVDLSHEELAMAPFLSVELFKILQPDVVIRQKTLCNMLNKAIRNKDGLFTKLNLNEARLRKFFNYYRSQGMMPIIASKDGCSISYEREIISKQILSLEQRARATMSAANGMRRFL